MYKRLYKSMKMKVSSLQPWGFNIQTAVLYFRLNYTMSWVWLHHVMSGNYRGFIMVSTVGWTASCDEWDYWRFIMVSTVGWTTPWDEWDYRGFIMVSTVGWTTPCDEWDYWRFIMVSTVGWTTPCDELELPEVHNGLYCRLDFTMWWVGLSTNAHNLVG